MTLRVCRLCGREGELKKSHIIPNAFFKKLFRNNNGWSICFDDGNESQLMRSNDSWWDYLLCNECEKHLNSKYEQYSLSLMRDSLPSVTTRKLRYALSFQNVNTGTFFLFCLSILWRASVSNLSIYSQIKLLHESEEEIRRHLCHNEKTRSGLVDIRLVRLCDKTNDGFSMQNLKDIVISPFKRVSGKNELSNSGLMKIYPLLALTLCCLYSNANAHLISFSTDGIKAWKKQIFSGETSYELVLLEGKPVLKALSNGTASGLVLKKRIDLLKTPYMSWSWRVSKTLPGLDERTKDGDDYAARIYIVIEKGFMGLKTKALNYVWSGSQAQGKVWNNAYAGSSVKMVSVRGKDSSTEKWYYEKRNVYEDMIKYFGDKGNKADNIEAYRYIDAIAVMTDTDNSGLVAESYYGDISFSSE